MFCSALRQARSVASWKTNPKARRRRADAGTSPATVIAPSVGAMMSATRRSRVDFPHPDGPSSETNSPGRMARLTPSSARRGPEEGENVIPTPSSRIAARSLRSALGSGGDTLQDVLSHRVLRSDRSLEQAEPALEPDRVVPHLWLHPAPPFLLGCRGPEERGFLPPSLHLEVAFQIFGVLEGDVSRFFDVIRCVFPTLRAGRDEVGQHVRTILEHVLAGEIRERVEADAQVPQQERLRTRSHGRHLWSVDHPAGDDVDLPGLQRDGIRADDRYLDLVAGQVVFRDDRVDERPRRRLNADSLAHEILRRIDLLVERDEGEGMRLHPGSKPWHRDPFRAPQELPAVRAAIPDGVPPARVNRNRSV